MVERDFPERKTPVPRGRPIKVCPWCGGPVVFEPYYPVTRLIPGEARRVEEKEIPERLRTVPAWVCETPHCRFREPA
jgi:hypothetical protein